MIFPQVIISKRSSANSYNSFWGRNSIIEIDLSEDNDAVDDSFTSDLDELLSKQKKNKDSSSDLFHASSSQSDMSVSFSDLVDVFYFQIENDSARSSSLPNLPNDNRFDRGIPNPQKEQLTEGRKALRRKKRPKRSKSNPEMVQQRARQVIIDKIPPKPRRRISNVMPVVQKKQSSEAGEASRRRNRQKNIKSDLVKLNISNSEQEVIIDKIPPQPRRRVSTNLCYRSIQLYQPEDTSDIEEPLQSRNDIAFTSSHFLPDVKNDAADVSASKPFVMDCAFINNDNISKWKNKEEKKVETTRSGCDHILSRNNDAPLLPFSLSQSQKSLSTRNSSSDTDTDSAPSIPRRRASVEELQ